MLFREMMDRQNSKMYESFIEENINEKYLHIILTKHFTVLQNFLTNWRQIYIKPLTLPNDKISFSTLSYLHLTDYLSCYKIDIILVNSNNNLADDIREII